jgi:hypothetical protein
MAQIAGDRAVESGGPDDDPDGEREDDGDERNDVVAKTDHENKS